MKQVIAISLPKHAEGDVLTKAEIEHWISWLGDAIPDDAVIFAGTSDVLSSDYTAEQHGRCMVIEWEVNDDERG
jgi:hypothetical protein